METAGPDRDLPDHDKTTDRVAERRSEGICTPTYGEIALRLLDNGYEPLPILSGTKRPAPSRWSGVEIDMAQVEAWSRSFGGAGIGLRTGKLVAVDIDLDDPDLAHAVTAHAEESLGPTLLRVGRWPRRLLIYRTLHPIRKLSVPGVEILGAGQQFVAFARHPDTGRPYEWVTGETPGDVPLDCLPLVDEAALQQVLSFVAARTGHLRGSSRTRPIGSQQPTHSDGPIRDADGLVIDGRDGWLSLIAFHAVHDALDRGEDLDPHALADRVWEKFYSTTDLSRSRQDGGRDWAADDALRKVEDKLSLHAAGRLPARREPGLQPEDLGELLSPEAARGQLSKAITAALMAASDWWSGDGEGAAPVKGIRATVGLGKSAVSRDRIAAWQQKMKSAGLPHRVLVVTPSHTLAEEAAAAWAARAKDPVAVLRGYEGTDPGSGAPMCQDSDIVKLALHESLSIGKSVCYSSKSWRCPHFDGCPKQQNKRDVAEASVVLAPYDVLFTGPAAGTEPFGLIVIDEGCWQRSVNDLTAPPIEVLATVGLGAGVVASDPAATDWLADLAALRRKAAAALYANGPGEVRATTLMAAGLTPQICAEAEELEARCLTDPEIYPGMKPRARKAAALAVKRNEITRRMIAVWHTLAEIMTEEATAPVLRIHAPDPETERRKITLHGHRRILDSLRAVPILHLDATLRPELAQVLLPGLSVTRIEAAQVRQSLTLVTGQFGKTGLCPTPGCAPDEMRRRQNRLREVVDHVRWQARRMGSRRTLVVTYKAIEEALHGIAGVETAHFNAIAGLDSFGDVGLLIVIGRPLPSSEDLGLLCASLFRPLPEGGYQPEIKAVHLRLGGSAAVRTFAHTNPKADLLRAAICDDEVIQAIGRGRGVNRTADNPLEVQVLANVALPLVHDRVIAWDMVKPDIVQRMLMGGIALDSPADAAALHPDLLGTENTAKKRFEREGFKGQNPLGNSYREMTLKSAAYRRPGRGRGWQRAWWISGSVDDAHRALEAAIGPVSDWLPVASD